MHQNEMRGRQDNLAEESFRENENRKGNRMGG